jgi:hypothetical protein
LAIPIFPNVEIAELLLNGRIGKQPDIHVLGIEINAIGGIGERSLDSLIDDGDPGIGRICFVQNENSSSGRDLRGSNALDQEKGYK